MSSKRSRESSFSTDPYQVLPNVQIAKSTFKKFINRIALALVVVLALIAVIYIGICDKSIRQEILVLQKFLR